MQPVLECGLQRFASADIPAYCWMYSKSSLQRKRLIDSRSILFSPLKIFQIGTQGWKFLSKVFRRPVLLVRSYGSKGVSSLVWNDHSLTDPLDQLTESISGSALVDILIPQDRCLVSVFEDRYLSCGSWVITNAYVYAFNPVPAKDRGPSIM